MKRPALLAATLLLGSTLAGCQTSTQRLSLSAMESSDARLAFERELWHRDPHEYVHWRREHHPEWASEHASELKAYDVAVALHDRHLLDELASLDELLDLAMDMATAPSTVDELAAQIEMSHRLRDSGLTSVVRFQTDQPGDVIRYRYLGENETHTIRLGGHHATAQMPVGFCLIWADRAGERAWLHVGPFFFVRPHEPMMDVGLEGSHQRR